VNIESLSLRPDLDLGFRYGPFELPSSVVQPPKEDSEGFV